ncbi:hypothetical protein [Hanstruepera marina]|uniref:hypothetical protein n=1 Tax=Hanstruepera marina TaxID=2873265 RepID=UPI001CA76BC9|nr:hypothetical protein [Hanstruepera marina]
MKVYKVLIVLFFVFATTWQLQSHPSWGIVVDENGCIYFADVMHNGDGTLWKLDPSTNELEAVFTNFHAHHIYLHSPNEIIAGIAKWRSGEIEGEGHNYLFKYDTQLKKLDTLLFTDDWDEYHGQVFSMSKKLKNVYFAMNKQIHIKPLNGSAKPLFDRKFERICTLASDVSGNLYISDANYKQGTLFKWNKSQGLVELANNLIEQNPKHPIFKEKRFQLFYGIAFSKNNYPLITESASRTIKEISNNGSSLIRYTSQKNWTPNGVYYHKDRYYIMETGYDNQHLGPRIIITDSNFKVLKTLEINFNSKKVK